LAPTERIWRALGRAAMKAFDDLPEALGLCGDRGHVILKLCDPLAQIGVLARQRFVRLGGIQGLRLLPSRAKIGGRASAPSTLSADATKSGAINVPEENVSSEAIDRFGGGTRPTAHPLHGCLRSELLGLGAPSLGVDA